MTVKALHVALGVRCNMWRWIAWGLKGLVQTLVAVDEVVKEALLLGSLESVGCVCQQSEVWEGGGVSCTLNPVGLWAPT